MNGYRLERNLIDMLKEEQAKLGYRSETVRLYYPLTSLNRLLQEKLDTAQMKEALKTFALSVEERLGKIEITNQKDRFCLCIPPKGVDYAHSLTDEKEFIHAFIRTIEKHGCGISDIVALFSQYSDSVHVEKTENGEFDYLIYFEDGVPDAYRYCLTDEGPHLMYHRFTAEDYADFEIDETGKAGVSALR